ncbi:helix-turn-helix domain-containing protein [Spirillospora sp. NBC_00431]
MTDINPMDSVHDFYVFHMRRLRNTAGLSQEALGPKVGYSGKFIGLVETKKRRPNKILSTGLDTYFELPQFFEALLPRIAEEAGLPPGFLEYIDEEALASQIKMYYHYLIPGLFQTEPYAREVLKAGKRADKIEELVTTRLGRQELLHKENPPNIVVLLDESVLRKIVGDREITRHQLKHLLSLIKEPHITIQVVPNGAQIYPEGSFALLSFDNEPDMGYEESFGGHGRLIEAGPHVTELAVGFDLIRSMALPAAESEALIRGISEAT